MQAAAIVNNEESKENPAEKSLERTTSPALFPVPNPAKPPSILDVGGIAPHILEQVNNSIKFGRSHSTSQNSNGVVGGNGSASTNL